MKALFERLFGGTKENPTNEAALRHIDRLKSHNPGVALEEAGFVALDTELTGLDFKKDSIVSIGALKMQGGMIQLGKGFYRLCRPESELKGASVCVHELTHTDLMCAEDIACVLEPLLDFLGEATLVCHFANIDLNFLNRAMKQHMGITLKNPTLDTARIHTWLMDRHTHLLRPLGNLHNKLDLDSLCKLYGVPLEKSHNSQYDAYMTAQLFQRQIPLMKRAGVVTIKEAMRIANPK